MLVLTFVTVVETPEFVRRADELMTDEEIYFFASLDVPLFALTVFAKNERADLSQDDRNAFRRLTKVLVETYRRRSR